MSNFSNVNHQKQCSLVQKVEAKLSAIQRFLEGDVNVFTVPDKFSYNWFCALSEGSLEPFSKSAKGVQPGTELRKRINTALMDVNLKVRKDNRASRSESESIAKLKKMKAQLEAQNKQLKRMLDVRTDENVQLRRELADLKRKHSIAQAAWNDRKMGDLKVKGIKP